MTTATYTAPQPVNAFYWQDKKRGFSSCKVFVLQKPSAKCRHTCFETRISIYTHALGDDSAYIDHGSNTPYSCSVERARAIAKQELENGYKFI